MSNPALSFDSLMEANVFLRNHLDSNASHEGFMFETYGPEAEFVSGMAARYPHRIATIVEVGDKMILIRGMHHVDRFGYLISKTDLPIFGDLLVSADSELSE